MVHSHWVIQYQYQKLHQKVTADVNGLSLVRKVVLNPLFKYILKLSPHSSVGRVSTWPNTDWWHNGSQFQAPPMPDDRYVEENSLATILVAKRSAGATQEMNIHFHQVQIRLSTLTSKPRGDVTRSPKEGYQ